MANNEMTGYFKRTYGPLTGRNWLKTLPPEEIQAFSHVGFVEGDYGRSGGIARAQTARRDWKGRFASNGGMNER